MFKDIIDNAKKKFKEISYKEEDVRWYLTNKFSPMLGDLIKNENKIGLTLDVDIQFNPGDTKLIKLSLSKKDFDKIWLFETKYKWDGNNFIDINDKENCINISSDKSQEAWDANLKSLKGAFKKSFKNALDNSLLIKEKDSSIKTNYDGFYK